MPKIKVKKKKTTKPKTMNDYIADKLRSIANKIKHGGYGDNPRYILFVVSDKGEIEKIDNFISNIETIGFLEIVKSSIITVNKYFQERF